MVKYTTLITTKKINQASCFLYETNVDKKMRRKIL